VLACATKKLFHNDDFYEYELDREKYEKDLTFLGFIIFTNKLKKETKNVIAQLYRMNCKLIMSTGDNPFTSISVAKQSEMIKANSVVYLIDVEKDKTTNKNKIKV
jgi:cation-transporting ATPase 13A2